MSLAIDVDNITHVLLADGWHEVHDASFGTDSYEFMRREGAGDSRMFGGGQEEHIAAAGLSFTEGDHIAGSPLAARLQRAVHCSVAGCITPPPKRSEGSRKVAWVIAAHRVFHQQGLG